ncbi:MutS2 family protein [Hallella bergensis DSM 17361]|uniref:Endonuclease MutS2 n=1 Tax=Hallella bergensis DSM 17361 TaxID=585502 RepID=D1PWD6_9BACT|nr:Smr/MutS family protein [Hallella bergensis]EFA44267.1 MutS2 family protein [Hallella bergensis DSM 17361]
MIYPNNFETKVGFDEIRTRLKAECLSTLGMSLVEEMAFSSDAECVSIWMAQISEMRRINEEEEDFPLDYFYDVRDHVRRVRLEGTWLEEQELFDLRRSLGTIERLVAFLYRGDDLPQNDAEGYGNESDVVLKKWYFPHLHELADGVATFPVLIQQIDQIIDKFGHIRDTASPELASIRRELARTEKSVSRILSGILNVAQNEGVVEKDVTPAIRDGRLVIPVAPALKRRISGIVHDESATGKTVFIEPTEVVEANNKIRELENEERQEIVRILTKMAARIRPHTAEILDSYHFLAQIDYIQAKAKMAVQMNAIEPEVKDRPYIDFIRARHPLLESHLKEGQVIVPLDIMLTPEKHILIISGPNAGGKSVCLKTVGLLQYMLQMGLSIPVGDRTTCGIFQDLMIDIGDEQSLENDLSTYSSHLLNMKNMMRQASANTLILIDEFGTGTEPQIGGAIAESVLGQFCKRGAWAVITTHYQNLKHFADNHTGVINGAMLYDRHEMKPLFQLAIGRPGSSFAIEIARKIGLPEEVIAEASELVGSDYIQSDKYLQDIVRDKRYWEQKRQAVRQQEKDLRKQIERYETNIVDVEKQRKNILAKAKQEADELLKESNRQIENTIREIREAQAEKEDTRRIRAEFDEFKQDVEQGKWTKKRKPESGILSEDDFKKKVEEIKARKKRREERRKNKDAASQKAAEALRAAAARSSQPRKANDIEVGDEVRIKGIASQGRVDAVDGKTVTVILGGIKTKIEKKRLELVDAKRTKKDTAGEGETLSKMDKLKANLQNDSISHATQATIDEHKRTFRQDLDIRGMRGDEALRVVQNYIDDAILMGVHKVRILHGKGNGILRQLVRQYLSSESNVTHFADEHVQFGGAGITVVDLG